MMNGGFNSTDFMDTNFNTQAGIPTIHLSNSANSGLNNIVFTMDMPRHEVGSRISVKEIQKRSAACMLCRNRKRKCDGQDPCAYCVSKGQVCTYTQQKKRGPQKRSVTSPSGTDQPQQSQQQQEQQPQQSQQQQLQVASIGSPSTLDGAMLDKLAARNFGSFYLRYMNQMVPMTSEEKMLNPSNSSHKVQAYSALAYAARICGDLPSASKYISQARVTAGDIYDSADADSVSGLLMMSNYWQLTLNIPLCAHYTRLAESLRRMVPKNAIDFRVSMVCEISSILCDETTSNKKKAKQLHDAAEMILTVKRDDKQYIPLIAAFLKLSSYVMKFMDYNPIFVTEITSTSQFFNLFMKVNLDEQSRMMCLHEINNVAIACTMLGPVPEEFDVQLRTLHTIFTPLYMAIVEWRSGNFQEALTFSIGTLNGLTALEKTDTFAFACGVVDFPHVAMIAGLCRFLFDMGHTRLAGQLCEKIRTICKLLTPEFDFVLAYANEFMGWLPADDQVNHPTPTITLLEEENNSANTNITNSNTNITNSNTNIATSTNATHPIMNTSTSTNISNICNTTTSTIPDNEIFDNSTINTSTNNMNVPLHTSMDNLQINDPLFSSSTSTLSFSNSMPPYNFDPNYNVNNSSPFNPNTISYNTPSPNYNSTSSPNYNTIPSPNTNYNSTTPSPNYNATPSPNYNAHTTPSPITINTSNELNNSKFYITQYNGSITTTNKIWYQDINNVSTLVDIDTLTNNNNNNANNNNNTPNFDTVTLIDSSEIRNMNTTLNNDNNIPENAENLDLWTFVS